MPLPPFPRRVPGPLARAEGALSHEARPPGASTHILLLLIRQQPAHLFPFPFNLFLIIVKFTDSEPSNKQMRRFHQEASGRSRDTAPRLPGEGRTKPGEPTDARPYLFSLALVLKSSITFRNRVTVKRPPSLSSAISLGERSLCSGDSSPHPTAERAEERPGPSPWRGGRCRGEAPSPSACGPMGGPPPAPPTS